MTSLVGVHVAGNGTIFLFYDFNVHVPKRHLYIPKLSISYTYTYTYTILLFIIYYLYIFVLIALTALVNDYLYYIVVNLLLVLSGSSQLFLRKPIRSRATIHPQAHSRCLVFSASLAWANSAATGIILFLKVPETHVS